MLNNRMVTEEEQRCLHKGILVFNEAEGSQSKTKGFWRVSGSDLIRRHLEEKRLDVVLIIVDGLLS